MQIFVFTCQLICLAVLFGRAPYAEIGVFGWALFSLGGSLAGWAFVVMNLQSRFHFLPRSRQGSSLLRTGPYRWWRHPMYAGVGFMGGVVALARWDGWAIGAVIGYVVVIEWKMRIEEAELSKKFPDYSGYMQKAARWIPKVY